MPRNTLTLVPASHGDGCHFHIGNPGGGHGMILTLRQLLALTDWMTAWREAGSAMPFVATQAPIINSKARNRSATP